MFTDIVGYSAMAHEREALALELLEEHRALVRDCLLRFNGREIKTIGDAFLVEFESAIASVRCAIEIQNAHFARNRAVPRERRLALRIGIHLGDIVLRDGDVYGDGVNIAARLVNIAGRSEIVFSEHVFEQLHNDIDVAITKVGAKRLKNIARPVVVYRIGPRPSGFTLLARFNRWAANFPTELRNAIGIAILVGLLVSVPRESLNLIFSGTARPKTDPKRIAVLPFTSSSDNHDVEVDYLSDGMTDELISFLSHEKDARVLSRNTIMKYRGSGLSVAEIGKELGAGTIIEGNLRRFERDLLVTVKIYDVVHGRYAWSRSFSGSSDDTYRIQTEMAAQLTHELDGTAGVQPGIPGRGGASPRSQAYASYLRGKFFLNQRTQTSLLKAIHEFETAIQQDRDFAPSYAAMALTYDQLAFFGFLAPKEAYSKATGYAEKALLLDNESAEAFLFLAEKKTKYDHDWDGADAGFRKAIELSPGMASAHLYYAELLLNLSKFEDAKREARIAIDLDPLNVHTHVTLGLINLLEHDFAHAEKAFRDVLDMNPDHILSHFCLSIVYLDTGKRDLAVSEMEASARLSHDAPMDKAALGWVYGAAGQKEKALKVLSELEAEYKKGFFPPYLLAEVYSGLGETRQTLSLLWKAFEIHDTHIFFLAVDPMFENLRAEPDYKALLEALHLTKSPREIAGFAY